jgi:hypothetical protein
MGPETKRELRKYAHRLIMTTTAAGAEMQFDDLAIVFIKTALADYWKYTKAMARNSCGRRRTFLPTLANGLPTRLGRCLTNGTTARTRQQREML